MGHIRATSLLLLLLSAAIAPPVGAQEVRESAGAAATSPVIAGGEDRTDLHRITSPITAEQDRLGPALELHGESALKEIEAEKARALQSRATITISGGTILVALLLLLLLT